jgi:hypothetical protein
MYLYRVGVLAHEAFAGCAGAFLGRFRATTGRFLACSERIHRCCTRHSLAIGLTVALMPYFNVFFKTVTFWLSQGCN